MVVLNILKSSLAATLLLLLTGCWTPVFDQDASLSIAIASKLNKEADFSMQLNNYSSDNTFSVYPSRERPPQNIVVLSVNSTSAEALAYSQNGSGGYSTEIAAISNGFTTPLSDPDQIVLLVGESSPSFTYGVFLPNNSTGTVQLFSGTLGSPYTATLSSDRILGVTTFLSVGTGQSNLMTFETNATNFSDNLLSPFNTKTFPAPTSDAFSAPQRKGWLATDGSNLLFLTDSIPTNGMYTTYRFDTTNLPGPIDQKSWTRSDRVVAFLSTSELLTKEGSFYDVCDSNGNIKFSFPAGNLRFALEFYDASTSTYRCWFTQILKQDKNGNFVIRLYTIPTADLSKLK